MTSEQNKRDIPAGYNSKDTTGALTPDLATDELDKNKIDEKPQDTESTPEGTPPAPGENVVDRQIDIIARM
ncbi:hypothetical protein [Chroococcidiopsis sp. TS-821]|uniref:hypothetical protein n=1 Tax=Chroococcidiopsis sp. TS-821 TaxID=1378066 RepID=UPI000CEEF11B|nr:hypothetical protein [Chroococcidiopsis sp. TS-821]PPS42289.1 hypothetical protein B1A85_14755 [Chroococcidiopsis sp. TS-821]